LIHVLSNGNSFETLFIIGGNFGRFLAQFGHFLALFGQFLEQFGQFVAQFGHFLEQFGQFVAQFGQFWEQFGQFLGTFWSFFATFLGHPDLWRQKPTKANFGLLVSLLFSKKLFLGLKKNFL
jgi:hypothetical protein